MTTTKTAAAAIPACLARDRLTSLYFPGTSRAALAAIATLAAIFVLTSMHRLNHTDLWGHVNFGRWIAEHGRLPATDPFAAAPGETPVLQAAWLAQWAAYQVQRLFGNEGLVFGHALLVTLTAAVLMLAAVRRGTPPPWTSAAGVALLVLELPIVGTIRPQLFGQLGAALFLLGCSELSRGRRHPLLWLPIVAALWANFHGSIWIGLAILGCFAIGAAWNSWRCAWPAWGAVGLVLAAACLHPHGPMLLVRTLAFNEHAALASISEWRALSPRSLTGVLIIASVALTALLVKRSPRRFEVHEFLLLALFGLATLPAMRMLAWWAVVWPWVCIPHAAAAVRSLRERTIISRSEMTTYKEPTAMRTVLAMSIVFMALLVSPPTYSIVAGQSRGEGAILVRETPIYVADELVRRKLAGAIACPMDWSDFLVWKTGGKLRPLVHSHVHLAEPAAWRDYQAIFRGDAKWLELLQRHKIQYLLVSLDRSPRLAQAVLLESRSGRERVRMLYQDQRCVLVEVMSHPPVKSMDFDRSSLDRKPQSQGHVQFRSRRFTGGKPGAQTRSTRTSSSSTMS